MLLANEDFRRTANFSFLHHKAENLDLSLRGEISTGESKGSASSMYVYPPWIQSSQSIHTVWLMDFKYMSSDDAEFFLVPGKERKKKKKTQKLTKNHLL